MFLFCFFFNDTATTEIYTLSLHDALPIWMYCLLPKRCGFLAFNSGNGSEKCPFISVIYFLGVFCNLTHQEGERVDRKSTRLNSSHANISYAVFCLKKKKNKYIQHSRSTEK